MATKREEWIWEFKRQMDLLRILVFARGYLKIGINKFFYALKNNEINYYWDRITAEKVSRDILDRVLKTDKFYKEEFGKFQEAIKKIDQEIDKFKKIKWDQLSNEKLFKEYENFYKLTHEVGIGAVFIRTLIFEGEPLLKKKLEEIFGKNYHEAFTVLTTPSETSFTQEEEESLLGIGGKMLKENLSLDSKEIISQIKKHLEEFAYIPCGYFDEAPYNMIDVKDRLEKITKLSAQEIENKIENFQNKKKIKAKRIMFLEKIKEDSFKNLVESLRLSVLYKEKIRGKINQFAYYAIPLFNEISKRTKLTLLEFKMLLPGELKGVLLKKKNYKKLIKERINFMLIVGDGEKYRKDPKIIIGQEAREKYNQLSKNILSLNQDIIKGVVANPGKIRGRVRIIRKYTDSIEKGEILVASMTTPEYALLMKKAAAIITDEGGITCHAAIVSRELKIPCIIGTKNATKILKDGDLVEVDAEEGIVKILNKKV